MTFGKLSDLQEYSLFFLHDFITVQLGVNISVIYHMIANG